MNRTLFEWIFPRVDAVVRQVSWLWDGCGLDVNGSIDVMNPIRVSIPIEVGHGCNPRVVRHRYVRRI